MRSTLPLLVLLLLASLAGLWFFSQGGDLRAAGSTDRPGPNPERGSGPLSEVAHDGLDPTRERTSLPTVSPGPVADPTQPAEVPPRLAGRVVDGEGEPVEGVRVYASTGRSWIRAPLEMEDDGTGQGWTRKARTVTDAQGRFTLDEPLRPGELRLAFRADGYAARYLEGGRLSEERPHDLGDIALAPGVTLVGRVADRAGKGVPGVQLLQLVERGIGGHTVTVSGRGVPLGETLGDGSFRVSGLSPGPWGLLLDSPEHQVREERGRCDAPGVQEGLLFVLEGGDGITGRVVGLSPARAAAARVEARATEEERKRDDIDVHPRVRRALLEDGRFHLEGLTPGVEHRLTLWEQGDAGRHARARDVPAVSVWPGSRDVVLEVERRATVTVKAVDAATGAPVEAFVFFAGLGGRGLSPESAAEGEDGQALRQHPGGVATSRGLKVREGGDEVAVSILAGGYAPYERSGVPITRGEALDLGEVELVLAGSVCVRVTGRSDGSPVEGARVVLATEEDAATLRWLLNSTYDPWRMPSLRVGETDAQGEARVSPIQAERCMVAVAAEGFLTSMPQAVPGGVGDEGVVEVALASGGCIDVQVMDTNGDPVVGVDVWLTRPGRDWVTAGEPATGPDGRVRLGPLEADSWTLHLGRTGAVQEAEPLEVDVVEGGTHPVTVRIPVRGALEGLVTQARVPLGGAYLTLSPLHRQEHARPTRRGWRFRGSSLSALSGHDGAYRIADVPQGEYRLQVTHPERYMSQVYVVDVAPGGSVYHVELPLTILEGTVRYEDGRPAPDLRVEVTALDGRARGRQGSGSLVEDDEGELQPNFSGRRQVVRTDASGRYRFVGVADGVELEVVTEGPYSVPASLGGLLLAPDELRSGADIEVQTAGQLSLRLGGGAVGSYRVVVRRPGEPGTRLTNLWQERTRTLDGLTPGEWTIELSQGRSGSEPVLTRTVQVVAGQVCEVVLSVQ